MIIQVNKCSYAVKIGKRYVSKDADGVFGKSDKENAAIFRTKKAAQIALIRNLFKK